MPSLRILFPTPSQTSTKRTSMPYFSYRISVMYARSGRKAKSTFDPSSGEMGMRLKSPRPTLMYAVIARKFKRPLQNAVST